MDWTHTSTGRTMSAKSFPNLDKLASDISLDVRPAKYGQLRSEGRPCHGVETSFGERLTACVRRWWDPVAGWKWNIPFHMLLVSLLNITLFYTISSADTLELMAICVPLRAHQWWKLVSNILVHADASHLWGNILITLTAGLVFETIHGTPRTAFLYWIGGVAGSAGELILWAHDDSVKYLLGASGALYAVIAAYAAHLAMNWTETPLRKLWLCCVVVTLSAEILIYLYDPVPNLAYAAHGFGAIFGFVTALCTVRNVRVVAFERVVSRAAACTSTMGAFILVYLLSLRLSSWAQSD